MARADYLELEFGFPGWMKRAHMVISVLGILAIWISPGPWAWKLILSLILAVVSALIYLAAANARRCGKVRVYGDDTAMYFSEAGNRVFATLAEHHWISRWFCSVAVYLAKGGAKRFLLISASGNDRDEYRRLLRYLKMRRKTCKQDRMIW